jgi:hypothetical protein
MITIYMCTNQECDNVDITYRVEDAPTVVICGGCGVKLEGVPSE